jgi:Inosine-uridine preferring nucleoside hydrolase
MKFPHIPEAVRLERLNLPRGKLRMVLDTDTFNEIDDQFAVVYSLLSPERLDVEAFYAAPFSHPNVSPAEGMEKSYEEILRLLDKLDVSPDGLVFKGATQYLADSETPTKSDAVSDLVERAMASGDDPLYVVAIGAITNVASAILVEPEIINKIVVVWLGGSALHWPSASEYNLKQDVAAARIVFDCGVPLVHIPCAGVTTHLRTTVPELAAHIKGQGAIGDYLYKIFCNHSEDHFAWSKEIWDIAVIAYLLDESWVPTEIIHSPIITDQLTWSIDRSRHFIRSAYWIDRDPIFRDLFTKIAQRNDSN